MRGACASLFSIFISLDVVLLLLLVASRRRTEELHVWGLRVCGNAALEELSEGSGALVVEAGFVLHRTAPHRATGSVLAVAARGKACLEKPR